MKPAKGTCAVPRDGVRCADGLTVPRRWERNRRRNGKTAGRPRRAGVAPREGKPLKGKPKGVSGVKQTREAEGGASREEGERP